MMRHMFKNILTFIAVVIAYVGAMLIVAFGFLSKLVFYIGIGIFFLYMLFVALPFLILYKFREFKKDPKGFIKDKVIDTATHYAEGGTI